MNHVQTVDLIIVGAGPAGLSTAMHLIGKNADWGQRMIVLEKATHPRSKLCGGGVTRFGLNILGELGFPLPLPIPQARVDNVYLGYRNRYIHVRGKPLFIVFPRSDFDHFLAKTAREQGVRILENEAVKSVTVAPDHVQVLTENRIYQAKIVVGADGSTGIVRDVLRDYVTPTRIARTLKTISPGSLSSHRFSQYSARFEFTDLKHNLQGYFWDFPSLVDGKPAINQGIYDARFVTSQLRANLPELLGKQLISAGIDPASVTLKGFPIRWFSPTNRISGNRVLLVGDAAGVDSLFGEGIGPALEYGKIAAQEIDSAFETNVFSFEKYRQRVLISPLGQYFLIRWLLANYVYHLGTQAVFMHALWTIGQIAATIWRVPPLY
jgi:flavin-dependent dehydrogenase